VSSSRCPPREDCGLKTLTGYVMRQLLFSLDRLEFQGSGKALVVGRCCGDPMKTGDQAQLMVRLSVGGRVETSIVASEPFSVSMPLFLVHDRKLDTLDSGYVAGLVLSVEVATGLRLGWYLKGQNA
jgi:hypothetical protein